MSMTNFEKQWKVAAQQARLEGKFYANFKIRHPDITIVQIQDSLHFQSMEDYQLFTDELEKFLKERRRQ